MARYILDEYRDLRKKKQIKVNIDEEMLYWLQRLSQMNEKQDRDDNTLQRVIRGALFIHLKQKLPNHFKMDKETFLRCNERTGKYTGGNERW